MIVKTLQLGKELEELLEKIYNGDEETLFLDYYGKMFEITPISKNAKKLTKAQKLIAKYSNLEPRKLTDPIFNENDPAQEKANFRNLRYGSYDK